MPETPSFNRLSVIIPTFNREKVLAKALQAYLLQSSPQLIHEILVVDDGSTDGTEAMVLEFSRQSPFPIRYLRQPNKGPAAARNLGIREAASSVVLFTDSDIVPQRELVEQHLDWHKKNPQLEAAVLGYTTWSPELKATPFMRWYGEAGSLFAYQHIHGKREVDFRFFYTCNLSLKVAFLRSCAQFDEDFRTAAYEDLDLGYRLSRHGLQLLYNPAATAYHYQFVSFGDACRKTLANDAAAQVFFQKEAGRHLLQETHHRQAAAGYAIAKGIATIAAKLLHPARRLLDSSFPLPGIVYHLFFWHDATRHGNPMVSAPDSELSDLEVSLSERLLATPHQTARVDISAEEHTTANQAADSGKKPFSIASVTVAHNGAGALSRHLDALKRQTKHIDEIVVVNNASTDNTVDLIASTYPEVTLLNLPENGGVGGGFAAGLDYAAITRKYDWVWLFDQDSVPSADALEQLLRGLQYLDAKNTAILAPVCVHPETNTCCPGHTWREGRFVPTPAEPGPHITLVDSVISSGSLVRREAIGEVGLPRADFFMDFVDYEHCVRLRRHGFKIAVVRDSLVHHALGDPSKFTVLGRTKYFADHAPWREYYMTRNEIFTVWLYFPEWRAKSSTLYRLARHALEILLFGRQKFECLRMMYRGFLDGRARRLGIRVLPTTRLFTSPSASREDGGPAVFSKRSAEDRA